MVKIPVYRFLIVGVIVLFIGVGIQPAIAIAQPYLKKDDKSEQEIETELSELLWKTYRNCIINGVFWKNPWPPPFPRNLFAFVFVCPYFVSCELSGHKGTISISQIIGFGFIGKIHVSYVPHIPSSIDGHLLFCIFKLDPDTNDITNLA